MTYREMAIMITKLAGKDFADRADEIIPDTEAVTSTDIEMRIHIPSLTEDPDVVPEITVKTNMYAKRTTFNNIIGLMEEYRDENKI